MPRTFVNHKLQQLILEYTKTRTDIDSLADRIEKDGVFPEEDDNALVRKAHKDAIRREIQKMRNADGERVIFSVVELGHDGQEIRKYKQMSLFSVEDFKQAIEYARRNKRHWAKEERYLLKHAKRMYGEDTTLFG